MRDPPSNVLLSASNAQSPYREQAVELIDEVARGPQIIYLFWPTVMAYLRLATHPAVFARPMSLADARSNVSRRLELPNVRREESQLTSGNDLARSRTTRPRTETWSRTRTLSR